MKRTYFAVYFLRDETGWRVASTCTTTAETEVTTEHSTLPLALKKRKKSKVGAVSVEGSTVTSAKFYG